MMKSWDLDVYYQAWTTISVDAHTEEEAIKIAEERVEQATVGIEAGSAAADVSTGRPR